MPKKASFNWAGIVDNNDGTFTVDGKAARKRLLKEYHKQGLQVRSHKESDGTYTLSTIGRSRKSAIARPRKPVRSIGQIRTRQRGRGYPVRGRVPTFRRVPRYGAPGVSTPGPRLHGGPNLGKGLGTRLTGYLQAREQKKQERIDKLNKQKEESRLSNEKLGKERTAAEKRDLENTLVKQRTTARLQEEHRQLEQKENIKRQQNEQAMRESVARADQRARQRASEEAGKRRRFQPSNTPYTSDQVNRNAQLSREQIKPRQNVSYPPIASQQIPAAPGVRRTSELPMDKAQMDAARQKKATGE